MVREEKLMKLAFHLAQLNAGKTAPNPWVGAVIVKNSKVIGKGFHRGAGYKHAEVEAIEDAKTKGYDLRGSEIFVSLQPCNSHGRTPPCTLQIEKHGIKKVFFSVHDPNIKGNYKINGAKVKGGILEKEGRRILLPYIKFITEKRPYIILKVAQTLDGKIADRNGRSKYITTEKSLQLVHKLRSKINFILVGRKTVDLDNPSLDVRKFTKYHISIKRQIGGNYPSPVKLIMGVPNIEGKKICEGNNTILIADKKKGTELIKEITERNLQSVSYITYENKPNPEDVIKLVYELGGMSLLVEGGGETHWQFIKKELYDEIWFFIAPKILGGGKSIGIEKSIGNEKNKKTEIEGEIEEGMEIGREIKTNIREIRRLGEDVLLICSKSEETWLI